ncbi:hypothetical protein A9239_13185 [Methanosarcina sp. A14]|nr:hypothetical protein A9239_13185 [Methanosarcina sp. A14]
MFKSAYQAFGLLKFKDIGLLKFKDIGLLKFKDIGLLKFKDIYLLETEASKLPGFEVFELSELINNIEGKFPIRFNQQKI